MSDGINNLLITSLNYLIIIIIFSCPLEKGQHVGYNNNIFIQYKNISAYKNGKTYNNLVY